MPAELGEATARLPLAQGQPTTVYLPEGMRPTVAGTVRYRINHIGAPVFGPRGEVALALSLIGFRGQIAAEEVPRYADRLMAAADAVTVALRGSPPSRS